MDHRISNSRAQESRLARNFGGKTQPGSGNKWHSKNDVKSERHSIEAKTTTKGQYLLKSSELEKGEKEAILDGKDFLFVIEMGGREWVTMAIEDFYLLLEESGRRESA